MGSAASAHGSDGWGRCLDKQQASFLVGNGNHKSGGLAWTFFGTQESHRTSGKVARAVEEGVGSLLSLPLSARALLPLGSNVQYMQNFQE